MPAPPEHLLVRPTVMSRLDRAASYPLTLVSAPAGTGKTVAVSTWARARRGSGTVVWMTLGVLDLRGGMPWSLLGAELVGAGIELDRPDDDQPLSAGMIADAIADHPTEVTLILDCAVDLSREDVAGLEQLLGDSMGRLRLVLLTRTDPILPLPRYRRQNTLAEIRMADLAFTADETRDLFALRGLDLSADELALVVARTRGWAAGLVLAALALANSPDRGRAIREFSGATGAIAEYLLAEVLDAQRPDARELLLRTSVAEVLRPGLIEVLAGNRGEAALAELTRGNAFIEPVPGHVSWYRYHPLFRELLVAQLSYQAPDEAEHLHRVAADWLARAGQVAEAVQTATDAGLWSVAAGYVVDQLAVADLLTPARTVLHELLAAVPGDTAGAAAALVRAALAVSDRREDDAKRELGRARPLIEAGRTGAEATYAIISAVRASLTEDPEAALAATSTADHMLAAREGRALAARPELAIVLDTLRARARLSIGPLSDAADACTRVVAGGLRAGFEWAHVECLGYLALIAAWRGENRKAVRLARQVLTLQDRAQAPSNGAAPIADATLAWVYVETHDLARARRHAAAGAESLGSGVAVAVAVTLAMVDSRIRRAQGDLRGARAILAECRRRHRLSDWWAERITAEEAVIEGLEAQRLAPTGTSVEAVGRDPVATLPETLPARVDRLLGDAHRRLRRGDEEGAVDSLEHALRLAAPERLRRPFREAPPDVRRLLRSRRDVTQRHGWLGADADRRARGTDPSAGPPDTGAPELVLPELLTEKEREVLGYLSQLLTTEEIAGAMFVSVNTIRTHVRNILRKLGASRRNQAIRRARELGILES